MIEGLAINVDPKTITYYGVMAASKAGLVRCLEDAIQKAKRDGVDCSRSLILSIDMPCGRTVNYQTYEDIPAESTPCPCGNPKHWLIKYGDL